MAVNWNQIRADYIRGGGSYAELSERYGVSFSTLSKRASAEKWKETKESQLQVIRDETDKKCVEKIAETESEVAATMARIRLRLVQKIETAVDWMEDVDTSELRKLVQCYKDMSEARNGTEEEKTGVLNDILDAVRGVGDD